ncbi:hypothetical protein AAIO99_30490, partial [Streptomyces sp. AC154]
PERRPYVPQQQQLRMHQPTRQTRRQGEGPPLPLRAERLDRPTPAEARPGIRPADDAVPALPPETGVVHGTMDRPQLPRRANQEHLVPQLREAPVPRTEEEPTLHDPGLVAAFRRGIDLGEARAETEPGTESVPEPGPGTDPAAVPAAGTPLDPLPVRGAPAPGQLLRTGSYHRDQDSLDANTSKE